jgi:hypothetical protein
MHDRDQQMQHDRSGKNDARRISSHIPPDESSR